jgi:hypothetical protein
MNEKLVVSLLLVTGFWLLVSSSVHAMGGPVPPTPTQEVEIVPTASEEALAKEQIENLREISINSKDINEGYEKFVRQVMSGKKYLFEFNRLAKGQLIKDALDKRQDWKYRFAIIGSLNPITYPEVQDVKIRILKDESEKIELRRYAAQGIADTNDIERKAKAVDALIEALKDDDWDIVASAANGLGELKDKRAVEPLIQSVRRTRENIDKLLKSGWKGYEKGTQPEDVALSCSIRALGHIGDKKAIPVLLDLLDDPYLEQVVELNDVTKGWAIIALERIGDKSVIEPIKKYLKTTKDFRVGEVGYTVIKRMEGSNEKRTTP